MLKKVKAGDVFGRLTATTYIAGSKELGTRAVWECACSCGNIHRTDSSRLKSGVSKMCRPCSDVESGKTRSNSMGKQTHPKEYNTWSNMKNRCCNPNYDSYHRYGGRGITVCEIWVDSFEHFLSDMGSAPSSDYSIERLDNEKGYNKENCRWVTMEEQQNNKSTNVKLDFKGRTQTIAQWCKELGLGYEMVRARIKRGLPMNEVLSVSGLPRRFLYKTPDGEFATAKEAAEYYGIKPNTASNRFTSDSYTSWEKLKV